MSTAMARQAFVNSHSYFLYTLVLDAIIQTHSSWPTQVGRVFSQPSGPLVSTYHSYPAINVNLSIEKVESNGLTFEMEAFRLEFAFPGLPQPCSPLVIYCPRQILAPGYVIQTLQNSIKEELLAWMIGVPGANSLMNEHVKNLQRKMRMLLTSLPRDAFVLHLPPNHLVGPTIVTLYGSSQVSVVNTHRIKIVVTTNDGYSTSYDCSRDRMPSADTVKAVLLRPYLAAV